MTASMTPTLPGITQALVKSALMVLLMWTVASCKPKSQVTGTNNLPTTKTEDGFLRAGFDVLSNFKYDTYEVYDEASGGRPLTKSDDVIPTHVKAYDGKRVVVKGFIMPLRLKKGLVTEFLLYRDQAACCFGKAAQMNHYMRVTVKDGFSPGSMVTHKVYGTLHVGEIYVQGYLTGIYQMTAEKVVEDP
jgi:hypothetical protein